jgi:hypothetical protein
LRHASTTDGSSLNSSVVSTALAAVAAVVDNTNTFRRRWRRSRIGAGAAAPNHTRHDGESFPYHPWLGRLIGNDVANDELGEYLTDQGRERGVLQVLGWEEDGEDALDQELAIVCLVLLLLDERGG